eukprot:TRINITY_DN29947_c0_g1_i1.p1 TRINITY_DN29947_c0_g1~~TRINITY_DN29947_c0_g1_i1.p1  ORF type:complete len:368 (+),score=58.55 TRINITY_DN29947_c0_g1_i1:30-1106(+)
MDSQVTINDDCALHSSNKQVEKQEPATSSSNSMFIFAPALRTAAATKHDDCECSTAATSRSADEEHDVKQQAVRRGLSSSFCSSPTCRPLSTRDTSIILDWDDTLLPTSFMTDAVRMYAPKCAATNGLLHGGSARPRRGSGRTMGRQHQLRELPKDFPCYSALQKHASLVEKVLRACKAIASRVAIVTLSNRPWVFESSDQYLPGLDLGGLLGELQIPVYYAGEHTQSQLPKVAGLDTGDPHVVLKLNAMAEFLQLKNSTGSITHGDNVFNVISVGDSSCEREAAKAALRVASDLREQACLCKTVKLMSDPSLKQLTTQLETLLSHLGALSALSESTDLDAQEPEELEAKLGALSVLQ